VTYADPKLIKAEQPTTDYIDDISNEYGIDDKLIRAVIKIESDGNYELIGDNGQSFGLMQVQPQWHAERMERLGITDLLDPVQNVRVGTDLLAELIDKYGDIDTALTVYNAGHDTGDRAYAQRVREEIRNDRN
jgi:soluble lytic murein transglycosylase-like protein